MPDSICSIYQEGKTGTLTSVNAGTVTSIDTRNFTTGLIAITNLGVANTLTYTVTSYANYAGATAGIADKTITDIAPSTTVTFAYNDVTRSKRDVNVVPKVAGSQSTYVINYCLGV